jgi:hypothetical protein
MKLGILEDFLKLNPNLATILVCKLVGTVKVATKLPKSLF